MDERWKSYITDNAINLGKENYNNEFVDFYEAQVKEENEKEKKELISIHYVQINNVRK